MAYITITKAHTNAVKAKLVNDPALLAHIQEWARIAKSLPRDVGLTMFERKGPIGKINSAIAKRIKAIVAEVSTRIEAMDYDICIGSIDAQDQIKQTKVQLLIGYKDSDHDGWAVDGDSGKNDCELVVLHDVS